jgi:hypothetical protein
METTIEIIQGLLGFLGFLNSIYLIGTIVCLLRLRDYTKGDIFISPRHEFYEVLGGLIVLIVLYSIIYFTLYFIFV